jgi:hypothetical protein
MILTEKTYPEGFHHPQVIAHQTLMAKLALSRQTLSDETCSFFSCVFLPEDLVR